jgi:hypothetical protein
MILDLIFRTLLGHLQMLLLLLHKNSFCLSLNEVLVLKNSYFLMLLLVFELLITIHSVINNILILLE